MDKETDNEIEFLDWKKSKFYRSKRNNKILGAVIGILVLVVAFLLFWLLITNDHRENSQPENAKIEISNDVLEESEPWEFEEEIIERQEQNAHTDIRDTTVLIDNNTISVNLLIYSFSHTQSIELVRTLPDTLDKSIVFATQAAFIRSDGKGILGAFVDKGKEISKGIGASTGFVAIINNQITIGMDNVDSLTPKLQQSISDKGYFFRQYPLVHNSLVVENRTKYAQKTRINRAIAVLAHENYGEIVVIESCDTILLHTFSQALLKIGVKDAVNLQGTNNVYGFYRDCKLNINYIGSQLSENYSSNKNKDQINWIIWRSN